MKAHTRCPNVAVQISKNADEIYVKCQERVITCCQLLGLIAILEVSSGGLANPPEIAKR